MADTTIHEENDEVRMLQVELSRLVSELHLSARRRGRGSQRGSVVSLR
jgi:hypothetical protein